MVKKNDADLESEFHNVSDGQDNKLRFPSRPDKDHTSADSTVSVNTYYKILSELLDKHAPETTTTRRPRRSDVSFDNDFSADEEGNSALREALQTRKSRGQSRDLVDRSK